MQGRILIVDDDPMVLSFIRDCLSMEGHLTDVVPDGIAADRKLQQENYCVVVSDVKLPGMDGLRLLSKHAASDTRFVMVSGKSTIGDAVEAMKLGAHDFLAKPFRPKELQRRVRTALDGWGAKSVSTGAAPTPLGQSKVFRACLDELDLVAQVPTTVLLTGETGTGKDVAASYLHARSPRSGGPMVSLHCGAIPDNLLEDELFGHVKGAFTGADAARPGCFETADGGTLFLDEIGTMSLPLQAKLLRVLQDLEIRRLGDSRSKKVDVRLVAATNGDLCEMVEKGEFRADLYYRLAVFPVELPRLADRQDDAILLARHFATEIGAKLGVGAKTLTPEAENKVRGYSWPGNVRQLENSIERAVVVSRKRTVLEARDLALGPSGAPAGTHAMAEIAIPEDGLCFDSVVHQLEKQLILKSLELSGGNKKQAAELLQLKRTTLIEKLKRLDGSVRAS